MNQGSGLGVAEPFAAKVVLSDAPQFGINQRHQAVERFPVDCRKIPQHQRDGSRRHRNSASISWRSPSRELAAGGEHRPVAASLANFLPDRR